jgi:hypothetical protein
VGRVYLLPSLKKANLSTPRPEGQGLPFDKLKAPSTVEGLEVHPEPRLSTLPSKKAGLRAAERVKKRIDIKKMFC